MLSVESCLRWYARKLGEDEELWSLTGLLHDFDYELHPEEHPVWGTRLLESKGWPSELVRAIASHYEERTGVAPESPLERHLFACDEITGFVAAVSYVRPDKDVRNVEVKSVVKKLKTPSFAAAVSRKDLAVGADLIGLPLEQHISNVLAAMSADAEALGLSGTAD
jgi:putative nucleotidyltransferase with HDIG domain